MKPLALFKVAKNFCSKHSNTMLTAVSIGGTIAAVYFAIKDTPKCMRVLEELEENDATNVQKAGAVVKTMSRTGIATVVSVAAQIVNHKLNRETIENLITTYQVASVTKDIYREKTKEIVGEEKAAEIERAVHKSAAISASDTQVIETGRGNQVFFDAWSGRFFKSEINFIKKVVTDLNYQLLSEMYISLNEYYADLGIPTCDAGKELGWNIDYGTIDLVFEAEMDEYDQPYTVVSFRNDPSLKYVGPDTRRW